MGTVKDIPHPNWDELQQDWLEHIPPSLFAPAVAVDELIRLSRTEIADKRDIPLISGVRERSLWDAVYLRDKALYCFGASKSLNHSGHSTLTAISMYDASFFAVKSLVYLLGIRDISRNSNVYLYNFKKEYKKGRVAFNGHYSITLNSRMTHDILWTILPRIISTIKGYSEPAEKLKTLRHNDYKNFSRERNRLIYECASWSRDGEKTIGDLLSNTTYLSNVEYFNTCGDVRAEYVDKYYRTAHTCLNFIDDFLTGLGKYAPEIKEYLDNHPGPSPVASVAFD